MKAGYEGFLPLVNGIDQIVLSSRISLCDIRVDWLLVREVARDRSLGCWRNQLTTVLNSVNSLEY